MRPPRRSLFHVFNVGVHFRSLQARNIESFELKQPKNTVKIARKIAEFHGLEMPVSKEPNFMWETISR